MRRALLGFVLIAACTEARADDDDPPPTNPPRTYSPRTNHWFVAVGPLVGAAIHDGPNGVLFGGEVSGGYLHDDPPADEAKPYWLGAYADVLYDTGPDAGRVSIGPEVGYFMFTLDAGVVRELGGSSRRGFSGRGSVSIPVWFNQDWLTTLSFHVRGVSWRDDTPGHTEIGLLLKFVTGG